MLHVAAEIAAITGEQADYIKHRAFDDQYYCDLILKYLKTFGEGRRSDFERLIEGKLSDLLNTRQKQTKIRNLLQRLRQHGKIQVVGHTKGSVWRIAPP